MAPGDSLEEEEEEGEEPVTIMVEGEVVVLGDSPEDEVEVG